MKKQLGAIVFSLAWLLGTGASLTLALPTANSQGDSPSSAERQVLEGTVEVTFDVDANGNVINVRLVKSSGNADLDRAAIEAVAKSRFSATDSGREGLSQPITVVKPGSDFEREVREQVERQAREQERQERERRALEQQEASP